MTVEIASDGGAAWRSETFAELENMATPPFDSSATGHHQGSVR
jgi:hypothetical protein